MASSDISVKMNKAMIRQYLKSPSVKKMLRKEAEAIKASAESMSESGVLKAVITEDEHTVSAHAHVGVVDAASMQSNIKHNALVTALGERLK